MKLHELEQKMLACTKCPLAKGRTNVVPGEGSPKADILLIGEGPGKNEDEQGRPFVGAAGKFLTELIESIGMTRNDVYIANVVKCRPPNNRDPLPDEVETCWPWLQQQIELINPKLIVLMGRHSLARFIPSAMISQDHGRVLRKEFPPLGKVIFFPCYHPAAALYNGSLREILLKDFKKIPRIIELIKSGKLEKTSAENNISENPPEETVKQGTLF